MQKTSTTILTLLVGLALSNTASAMTSSNKTKFKCSTQYNQVSMTTGKIEEVRISEEFLDTPLKPVIECLVGTEKFISKINKWIKQDNKHIAINFQAIQCKVLRSGSALGADALEFGWSEYRECKKKYTQKLVSSMVYPQKITKSMRQKNKLLITK
jgi:ABC-type oligopeptide transport system ATPase subunit